MGIFKYYGQVVRVAFTHSLGVTQDILFVVYIVGGLILYLLRGAGMISDVSAWMAQLTGWQIAASVMALIIATRLLLAPYWMYRQLAGSGALNNRADQQEIADHLAELHHEVMEFVYRKITVEEFSAWNEKCLDWLQRTAAYLQERCTKAELLGFAGTHPASYYFSNRISDEHNGKMCLMKAHIDKLQLIIDARQEAIMRA